MNLFNKVILTLSLLINLQAFACDECNTFDYSTLQGDNYFGIQYRYSLYNGYVNLNQNPQTAISQKHYQNARIAHIPINSSEYTYVTNNYDYEAFKTIELRYSHTFNEIFNLLVYVPIHKNYLYFKEIYPVLGPKFDSLSTNAGLGDITVSASKYFKKEKGNYTHRINYGLGLTLPTGKFDIVNEKNEILDPDHQLGKGAAEIIVRLNYSNSYQKKVGIRSFINYTSSMKREDDGSNSVSFRQGNRTNAKLDAYYTFGNLKNKFIPSTGLYFEDSRKDRLNEKDWDNTGGTSLYLSIMPEIKIDKIYIQPLLFYPLYQELNGEQLQNSIRMSLSVLYSF